MSGKLANRRIRLLLVLLATVFGLALARTAWLQTVRAADLSKRAASQQRETITIPAGRGTIFDRMGVQLALGEEATTVYADPHDVRNPRAVALLVQKELRLRANALYPHLPRKPRRYHF